MLSFQEVLTKLRSSTCGPCRHWYSASFVDDVEYDLLEEWYRETVAALTTTDGAPMVSPQLPGVDVERSVCWKRGDQTLYAVLSWGDNTRVRILTVGLFSGVSLADEIMRPNG